MINNKKVVCIIQARINSTRLPIKVMLPIYLNTSINSPIIEFLYHKIKNNCPNIDQIIIATGEQCKNYILIDFCLKANIPIFIGQEENVFNRVLRCAQTYEADIIVEITGDCPLIPTEQINYLLNLYNTHKYIEFYASNIYPKRTWPDGFDIRIYTINLLKKVLRRTYNDKDQWKKYFINKEHVGWNIEQWMICYFINQNSLNYILHSLKSKTNYAHWGLTLDTQEDYELITTIIQILTDQNKKINTKNIINLIKEKPELLKINSHIKRKVPNE